MVTIFVTGGTIDASSIDSENKYFFDETHIPNMLKQARCTLDIDLNVLFLKDSLYTTDLDRNLILESCLNCLDDKIIISHGTDTMAETAKLLGDKISSKTIILFGAMVPFISLNSDSLFNLGFALSSVQILGRGIYVAMNGQIFSWDNVMKNKSLGVFEEL